MWERLIQGQRLQISHGYNLACKASTLYIFMKQCSVHLYLSDIQLSKWVNKCACIFTINYVFVWSDARSMCHANQTHNSRVNINSFLIWTRTGSQSKVTSIYNYRGRGVSSAMHAGSLSKLAMHKVVYLCLSRVVRALRNCGSFSSEKPCSLATAVRKYWCNRSFCEVNVEATCQSRWNLIINAC